MKRSRGPGCLLTRRGIHQEFPGFPGSRNLFQSSRREVAGHLSGTFRGLPHCFDGGAGIYHRFRQSAPGRPIYETFGSRASLWLRAKAGCREVQSGGRSNPYLGAAHWPSPRNLPGVWPEPPSNHIINHPGEKNKGVRENFLGENLGCWHREAGPGSGVRVWGLYQVETSAEVPSPVILRERSDRRIS